MTSEDELKQLRAELQQLQQQTVEQYHRIGALQKRLSQALPEKAESKVKTGAGSFFSLENFIGLRLIHFVGIVVLVIGLSIGVKYAIDRQLISESLRILLAYTAGLLLYLLSLRLKKGYLLFSAILFSGGMASLYFTTYAAFVYYKLIPFGVAYGLMAALTVFTVYQALVYNRQLIAVLGLIGAYAIPFLISPNAGNIGLFFLYLLIINLGITYLTTRKPWWITAATAQGITWLLYFGATSGSRALNSITVPTLFLAIFFFLFFVALLFSKTWRNPMLADSRLTALLANNGTLYIGILLLIGKNNVEDAPYAGATLAMSIFLTAQAFFFYRWQHNNRFIFWLAGTALALFVLAIGINWAGITVTLLWMLTAVIVFTAGVVLKNAPARVAGMVLMAGTLGKLIMLDSQRFTAVQKVIAYLLLGVLLLLVSFYYQRAKNKLFKNE